MKLNFKTLIIIFLVALLGAGLGTFGVMNFYNVNPNKTNTNNTVTISQTNYTNKKETSYSSAIEKAYNTVVEITSTVKTTTSNYYFYFGNEEQYSTASGSGVIISEDGYIVTNEHVISGYTSEDAVNVKLYNGEEYVAKVIGYDTRTDLAVLKINENNLPYAEFADSSQLVMGEDVIAIGNPLGLGVSCSNGIISALEKEIYINNVYLTVIQTNAAVNAGNSGGGLFDINGNIVGIVNAKKTSSTLSSTTVEGMGYAIPANTVVRIVNDLISNGYVKDRAALGVRVYTSGQYYTTDGVVISDASEGGSAEKAGLKPYDKIIAIDDVEVNTFADISKILDTKSVGEEVTVTVVRDGKQMDFKVVLQNSVSE